MACCSSNQTNSCNNSCMKPRCGSGSGYLLIIVLYILLAIIVGSYIC